MATTPERPGPAAGGLHRPRFAPASRGSAPLIDADAADAVARDVGAALRRLRRRLDGRAVARRGALAMMAAAAFGVAVAAYARADPLVFAAASTKAALEAAIEEAGLDATVSYAASGALARQIEAGAPADLFLSANPQWMAHLVEEGLVDAAAVSPLLSNRLVLIAPAGARDAARPLALTPAALAARLADERFVMAHPASAPLGRYGEAALTSLGLWDVVSARLAPVKDAPATVAMVARGEAALGLAYATDAVGVKGIVVAAELPETAHPPIRYLVAPIAEAENQSDAQALLAALTGPAAVGAFERRGFVVLSPAAEEAAP